MIFDQYSRYKACAYLLRQAGAEAGNTVLDIGSGPECLFSEFVPDMKTCFVDPLIPPGSGEQRITGTVFTDELEGRVFDCVTAVDVFEHIPAEKRVAFLERISSLSMESLVLGFPTSDSSDAHDTDRAIGERYTEITGTEYPWLKEHYEYGLPSLDVTVDELQTLGWHCQTIGHGYAPWLRELLTFIVCSLDHPALKDLVLNASERFKDEFYSYDFRPPYYRQFVIASRKPQVPITLPVSEGVELAESQFRVFMDEVRDEYFETSLRLMSEDTNLTEWDAAVVERDAAVVERDAAVVERDAAVVERDAAVTLVNKIRGSTSWRITRPLRFIAHSARYGVTMDDPNRLIQKMRFRYQQLPLPMPLRRAVSFTYHRILRWPVNILRHSTANRKIFQLPTFKPTAQEKNTPDCIIWGIIDWHFRHQRPQHLAFELTALNRRVFYVSDQMLDQPIPGFDVKPLDASGRLFHIKLYVSGAPNIHCKVPGVEDVQQLRASIGELLEWADIHNTISLVQHPFWYDVASCLPHSRMVYDCMDHHEGFGNIGSEILTLERALIAYADLTVTTSVYLEQIISKYTDCLVLIRNAADYNHFARQPEAVYRDKEGRSIIGYYGAIAEWFDQDLVEAIAERLSNCLVLLVGTDSVNAEKRLGRLQNVKFIGEVSYDNLPYYLHSFDVCILPFQICPLTLATNPVKVYEYLSAGKAVVSVDLPELQQFGGFVSVAANATEFIGLAMHSLDQPATEDEVSRRQAFAQQQTWSHRAEALINSIDTQIIEPLVSVVVVTYNNLDLTKACLFSLDEHSDYSALELIVVDNASTDGSLEFLTVWAATTSNRKLILNEENKGFAAANNQGLKIATGEFLVLLNNDTFVTPGWVLTMMRHLQRDATIGLIGPVTNNIGNEARIDISYSTMVEMHSASASYTRRHIGQTLQIRTTAFFCVMMPLSVYQKVGPLDEAFGRGFFEDDDYCRRVEQLGLRIVCAEDVFVHHHLSASFGKLKQEERQRLFEGNRLLYEKKWGEWIPHGYREKKPNKSPSTFKISSATKKQYLSGTCIVCGKQTQYLYTDPSILRESLTCSHCLTTSRYRSIARGLLQAISELRDLQLTSLRDLPCRGSINTLRVYDTQPPFYYHSCAYPLPDILMATGWIDVSLSQYRPTLATGAKLGRGITNQNLEALTFADDSFDIIITSDVMEHVRMDEIAHREIYRVLKPGGIYVFTVPHDRSRDNTLVRVKIEPDDPEKDVHLLDPEYHGDTNSETGQGVLAYRVYGRDLEDFLFGIGFDVNYSCKDELDAGIMSTELYYCRKHIP